MMGKNKSSQTRENDYVAHTQHLGRRATSTPLATRYTRKVKHKGRGRDDG